MSDLTAHIKRRWRGYVGAALLGFGFGVEWSLTGLLSVVAILCGLDLYARQTISDVRNGE